MPFFVFPRGILWHAFCVWGLRWQCMCCCWRIPKAFSRSKDSISKCIYANSPDIEWYWFSSECFCESEREVVRTINTRENILQMVQRSLRLSTRRMASRIGVSHMQAWRTLHEEELYPYHDQRVQHLEPGDHAQRMDFCHWIKAHPELLSVILFSDEASFTRDGVKN